MQVEELEQYARLDVAAQLRLDLGAIHLKNPTVALAEIVPSKHAGWHLQQRAMSRFLDLELFSSSPFGLRIVRHVQCPLARLLMRRMQSSMSGIFLWKLWSKVGQAC